MSNILNEALKDEAQLHEMPPIMPEDPPIEQPAPEAYGLPHIDFGFLRSETGSGSIEDYLEHPLNFDKSRGVAQILRGLTGIAGNLNLAVIDIALGSLQIMKDKRATNEVNTHAFNL